MAEEQLVEAMAVAIARRAPDAFGSEHAEASDHDIDFNADFAAQERLCFRETARAALAAAREAGWRLVPAEASDTAVCAALEEALAIMQEHGVDGLSPFADYPAPSMIIRRTYRAMVSAVDE